MRLKIYRVVKIKINILWDVLPCSLVGRMFHRNIGICCFPVTRMSNVENQGWWYDPPEMLAVLYHSTGHYIPNSCNLNKLKSLCKLSDIFLCFSCFWIKKSFIQNLQNVWNVRFIWYSNIKNTIISHRKHTEFILQVSTTSFWKGNSHCLCWEVFETNKHTLCLKKVAVLLKICCLEEVSVLQCLFLPGGIGITLGAGAVGRQISFQ